MSDRIYLTGAALRRLATLADKDEGVQLLKLHDHDGLAVAFDGGLEAALSADGQISAALDYELRELSVVRLERKLADASRTAA